MEQVYIIVFVDFSVFNGLRDRCFEKTTKNSQNLHSAHVMIFLIPQNLNSYAYGEQKDYFDDEHTVGWVRQGDTDHNNSAIAVVLNNSEVGTKQMEMGTAMSGVAFYDALGNFIEPVVIDSNGYGIFPVAGNSVSVWVQKKALEDLTVNE